ncbi:MAG: hypothetical protein ACRCTZ_15610 [Sarcina sp.]
MERHFEEYRDISLKLLEDLETEEFTELESFLEKKQKLILEVANLELSAKVVRENLEKFQIAELDKKIIQKIELKKIDTKKKINEVGRRKSANNVYANAGRQIQYLNSVR